MMMKLFRSKGKNGASILVALLVVVVALFVFMLSNTIWSLADDGSVSSYQVNEYGQTYGSAALAGVIGKEPDLVAVLGENGVEGYSYSSDLRGPVPTAKDDIREWNKKAAEFRSVPVYKEDGRTVIGEFIIGGGGYTVDYSERPQELLNDDMPMFD